MRDVDGGGGGQAVLELLEEAVAEHVGPGPCRAGKWGGSIGSRISTRSRLFKSDANQMQKKTIIIINKYKYFFSKECGGHSTCAKCANRAKYTLWLALHPRPHRSAPEDHLCILKPIVSNWQQMGLLFVNL